ncbi:MAG TPA: asparagine synthase B [Longimicrobiales bacterium]|nr:asparagine synthase B [Longimicrobiales bacterium]
MMCSILGVLEIKSDAAALRRQAIRLSKLQRHRGPDWSGVYTGPDAILAHERLAIVDVIHGAQPLLNEAGTHALAVNGEIYNHRELREELKSPYPFQTESDCEIILALYRDFDVQFLDILNGIFAFVLYDSERKRYLIARDHMGIVPLYMGEDETGNVYVASEMKALVPVCKSIREFPPGHYLDSEVGEPRSYYEREWRSFDVVEKKSAEASVIRQALTDAVERQLMSDVPYGVLLSGGLDSSIIAAVARKFAERRIETHGASPAWWPQLHSFSIGLHGSPDLAAAETVAEHIGSIHHGFEFTVQEGFDALSDVIYHLETYDVTTIRAATPMYLMARRIRAMGVKMVLSGEGADEVFGGYLYFHKAPDARSFHEETIRKLDRLHWYDCLRANKAMAAWGVEARVPFLDKEFLDVAMSISPAAKMSGSGRIEKHILREAFADMLPESIAWRQKEQFSDGVGYNWIDSLRAHAEAEVSDQAMSRAAVRFPYNTPPTKEAYFYRSIFADHFHHDACARCVPGGASVACSTPEALAWDASLKNVIDPSGRAVRGVHNNAL